MGRAAVLNDPWSLILDATVVHYALHWAKTTERAARQQVGVRARAKDITPRGRGSLVRRTGIHLGLRLRAHANDPVEEARDLQCVRD